MFKQMRLKKLLWFAVPVLAVLIAWWVIDWLDRADEFRLIAHYSAGEMPPANAPRLHGDAYSDYRKYLDEGPLATFTETGLFLYETGGDPVHCDREDAVVAKRDWQGRRLWAVTLPKSAVRRFVVSPDGHYLAAVHTGAPVEVLKDGKSVWKWQPAALAFDDEFRLTDDGRLFAWTGGRLSIVQDGKVIATHPHLPLQEMRPDALTKLQFVPDGSALVGLIHPRSPGSDDIAFYFGETPTLVYLALTVKGGKVVPVSKYRIPFRSKEWYLLSDGSVLTERGAIYLPDGSVSEGQGWYVQRFGGKNSTVLWRGDEEILSRRTPRGPRFRLLNTRTGRGKRLDLQVDPNRPPLLILPSSDGRHVLTYGSVNTFPPTVSGRLAQWLAARKILTDVLTQRFTRNMRFDLCDPEGQTQASLSVTVPRQGSPYVTAGGRRYLPVKYALSPDARHLVLLGVRVDNNQREYLHFAR
ncbi:MAG: hypothetical protein ACYDCO_04740 [Armatimonadota bacterium]